MFVMDTCSSIQFSQFTANLIGLMEISSKNSFITNTLLNRLPHWQRNYDNKSNLLETFSPLSQSIDSVFLFALYEL